MKVSSLCNELMLRTENLDRCISESPEGTEAAAFYAADKIIPAMEAARKACDSLEAISDKEFWPVPTYSEILFYV